MANATLLGSGLGKNLLITSYVLIMGSLNVAPQLHSLHLKFHLNFNIFKIFIWYIILLIFLIVYVKMFLGKSARPVKRHMKKPMLPHKLAVGKNI